MQEACKDPTRLPIEGWVDDEKVVGKGQPKSESTFKPTKKDTDDPDIRLVEEVKAVYNYWHVRSIVFALLEKMIM